MISSRDREISERTEKEEERWRETQFKRTERNEGETEKTDERQGVRDENPRRVKRAKRAVKWRDEMGDNNSCETDRSHVDRTENKNKDTHRDSTETNRQGEMRSEMRCETDRSPDMTEVDRQDEMSEMRSEMRSETDRSRDRETETVIAPRDETEVDRQNEMSEMRSVMRSMTDRPTDRVTETVIATRDKTEVDRQGEICESGDRQTDDKTETKDASGDKTEIDGQYVILEDEDRQPVVHVRCELTPLRCSMTDNQHGWTDNMSRNSLKTDGEAAKMSVEEILNTITHTTSGEDNYLKTENISTTDLRQEENTTSVVEENEEIDADEGKMRSIHNENTSKSEDIPTNRSHNESENRSEVSLYTNLEVEENSENSQTSEETLTDHEHSAQKHDSDSTQTGQQASQTVGGGTENKINTRADVEENSKIGTKEFFSVFRPSRNLTKTTEHTKANLKMSLKCSKTKSRKLKISPTDLSSNSKIYNYFSRESRSKSVVNLLRQVDSDNSDLTDCPAFS